MSFVATALPDEDASQLTEADVRLLLGWHADHLHDLGEPGDGEERMLVDDDAVTTLLNRARSEGQEFTAGQVEAVLTAELAYLEAIGAIGPPAGEKNPPE